MVVLHQLAGDPGRPPHDTRQRTRAIGMKDYTNSEPMSESALAYAMENVERFREQIDAACGYQFAELLLWTIGRVRATPDAEMPDERPVFSRWTGD